MDLGFQTLKSSKENSRKEIRILFSPQELHQFNFLYTFSPQNGTIHEENDGKVRIIKEKHVKFFNF